MQLVDPVDKTVERDLSLINDLGLKLIYALNTHVHADHVTGTGILKVGSVLVLFSYFDVESPSYMCCCIIVWRCFVQSRVPDMKSVISKASDAKADILVEPGDKIVFGDLFLEVYKKHAHV